MSSREGKNDSSGTKDKTQAVERPPGDVHLRLVAVDVINGSLNGGDFLSFFVRNLSIKLFFQSHYQLNGVKRIRAQVFNERSIVGNFFLLNAQLFADNFLNAFFDSAHTLKFPIKTRFRDGFRSV
ncbi:Hypothetical protein c1363 [Escherichia coli CFT073]|uniref:Uncharacterized protein n=2 Tax=Escherichia coli TaxID=562 RepID=A0A0H2V791_ECOL6|nr:Hypothetical protein c1363 [Escherichia coli CFT073]ABE06701.1 hypothetical protein UTI89_C1219 [Escherichia coli UTI89]ADN45870.1 conserved hypothetical protein [Escherichia coli ABU 83972]